MIVSNDVISVLLITVGFDIMEHCCFGTVLLFSHQISLHTFSVL